MSDEAKKDPDEYIREKLGSKREILEALVELDNPLSEDAERALQILKEDDQE